MCFDRRQHGSIFFRASSDFHLCMRLRDPRALYISICIRSDISARRRSQSGRNEVTVSGAGAPYFSPSPIKYMCMRDAVSGPEYIHNLEFATCLSRRFLLSATMVLTVHHLNNSRSQRILWLLVGFSRPVRTQGEFLTESARRRNSRSRTRLSSGNETRMNSPQRN